MGDCASRERADSGTDEPFRAIVAAADEVTEQISADRAGGDADRGAVDPLLAGIRVGGACRGGQRGQGGRCKRSFKSHEFLQFRRINDSSTAIVPLRA